MLVTELGMIILSERGQQKKAQSLMVVTELGIEIDLSPVLLNACPPILVTELGIFIEVRASHVLKK